jgi:signal transduction histidine kinase
MRIKLVYKFIFAMIFISVVPLTIVGLRTVKINEDTIEESTLHNHITTAGFLAKGIDDFMVSLKEKLLFLISSQSIESLDFTGKQVLIQSLVSSTEYFVSVSMVNKKGEEFVKTYNPDYAEEAAIKNLADETIFKNAVSDPVIGDIYMKDAEPRLDIIYPVRDEYIFITVTLKRLWEQIKSADIGYNAAAFLVDDSKKVLAHRLSEFEGKVFEIPPVNAVITRAGIGSMEYEYEGLKMVGAYAPVESMGWGVVTQQPHDFAFASAIKMRKNAYKWIIIAIILALFVSHLLARGLSRPILSLSSGARAVASGNFDHSVNVKTGDELQDLVSTFNDMVRSLKKYKDIQVDKIMAERTKTESVIFSIEDGIVLTDFDGKVMLVNDRAIELMELDGDPAEGVEVLNYLKNERMKEAFADDKEAVVDLSSEDRRKIIRIICDEVVTKNGKKLGKVRIIRDITLEKEIEEIKERFLHSITHDLKNPLSAIAGVAELLKRNWKGEMTELEDRYFSVMKSESERLMGMINDILDLARIEAGMMELNVEEFDISEMARDICDTFSAHAENSGLKLVPDVTANGVVVNADPKLIKRVLVNLLGNALKYTPSGGKVTISTGEEADKVRVSVTDTGKGIPEEWHEKIFDRFQRIKNQIKGGAGIGLNVSREIVEVHGGRIWIESEIEKGSSFIFELPKNAII